MQDTACISFFKLISFQLFVSWAAQDGRDDLQNWDTKAVFRIAAYLNASRAVGKLRQDNSIVLLHVAPLLSSFIACETQGSLALNFVKCMTEPNRMTWIEACPCCQMGFDMRQTNLVYPSMCRDALGDSQDA